MEIKIGTAFMTEVSFPEPREIINWLVWLGWEQGLPRRIPSGNVATLSIRE